MAKKIKVMHIINNLGIGGAERVLYLLLEELAKRPDLEITLVSLEGHGDLEGKFRELPINFKKFHYHLFVPIFRRFEPYFRLRLYLYARKVQPDIIHGHLIKGEDFAKVLGGLLRKPVVSTNHDCHIKPGRKQKWLNRFLTKDVAVSLDVKEHLMKYYDLPADKIIIIPDGIKIEDFNNSLRKFNPEQPIFFYLGRLIKEKGVQFAIEGLSKLNHDYPGLKLLIFGDGYYRPDLEAQAKKLGADFVHFKGKVSDVPAALKEGDIFVLPSKSEGFSMSTLEAAAAGKPLLATSTGAIPEMLKDGFNGYFVKYGNADSVYQKAKELLEKDSVVTFGKNSVGMAQDKFSIEKVADLYYNLYRSVEKNS